MGIYFQRTLIPPPKIDYKNIWKNDPGDLTDTKPRWKSWPPSFNKLWDAEIINKLRICGLPPTLIRIFRWPPGLIAGWHIDGNHKLTTQFAINWILDGQGVIQWNSKLILENNIPHAYGFVPSNKDDMYEEQTDGHGCIVNTAIPHRVINNSPIHRITCSMLFDKDPSITYNDAVGLLSNIGFIKN